MAFEATGLLSSSMAVVLNQDRFSSRGHLTMSGYTILIAAVQVEKNATGPLVENGGAVKNPAVPWPAPTSKNDLGPECQSC